MKVAIVGAGPAGLMAAATLSSGGESTTIFERSDKVGVPVKCGEALMDPYQVLESDPHGTRAKIQSIRVHLTQTYVFRLGGTRVCMVDKDRWLQHLAIELEREGVEIRTSSPVSVSKLRREFDYVLDCSGCPSQSSKEYGIEHGELGLAIEYRAKGDFRSLLGHLHFHFVPDEVGFRWIFPKSETEANVGVGWARSAPSKKWSVLSQFASKELGDYSVKARAAGYVPYEMPPRLKMENLMLCGDAAGLANAYHGGGIHNALVSGKLAAQMILNGTPELYQSSLRRTIGGELKVASFARSMLEDSYLHHEKMVEYVSERFSLGELFTEKAYRTLQPLVQIWRLRRLLVGHQFQAF